jgi:hypothetical protein
MIFSGDISQKLLDLVIISVNLYHWIFPKKAISEPPVPFYFS